MKKFFVFCLMFISTLSVSAEVLQAGVAMEDIPDALFGTWRVNAKLDKTNSYKTFKPQSVDCWNLSKSDEKINLDNPFSGAKAEISVNTVEGNLIVFSKETPYGDNKFLSDKVHLRIDGDKFSGINTLSLETYSSADGHLIKTENATYIIKGEKISGESVFPFIN